MESGDPIKITIFYMCMYLWCSICSGYGRSVCIYLYVHQVSSPHLSPTLFLRQGLSLNMRLTWLAESEPYQLAAHCVSGICKIDRELPEQFGKVYPINIVLGGRED